MHILEIEIVNQKAIKVFQKNLDGENLEISGQTGTGKTTAVSALWEVLQKGSDTLSHGESKGHIRVRLGDKTDIVYEAVRTSTPKTSSITITKLVGGKPMPVNTKDFENMMSKLSINPHRIADMKPKERSTTLLSAAELDVDLDALDEEIRVAEQERLFAKRDADNAKCTEIPEKVERVSVSDLIAERDAINKKNEKFREAERSKKYLEDEKIKLESEAERLNERLAEIHDGLNEIETRMKNASEWLSKNFLQSTDSLDIQIEAAESTNERAAVYEQAVIDKQVHDTLVHKHKEADQHVKELVSSRKSALDNAKWPLAGLSVSDGDVYYNGILFDNLGESEQMLVTAAIAIGDIEKYPMKIVRMDGIESMSKKDYEKLRTMFNVRGIQVLSTRVSRGDVEENEIVINEGTYTEE